MDLTELKGIKEARGKLLNDLGIFTGGDLLNYFPSKYYDLNSLSEVSGRESPKLLECKIISVQKRHAGYKRSIISAKASCQNETIDIVWFNQPYIADKVEAGTNYIMFSKCGFKGGLTLINPVFEKSANIKRLKEVMPVYPLCEGLSQSVFSGAIKDLLEKSGINTAIPLSLIKKYSISDLKNAYNILHCPQNTAQIRAAADRVALEVFYNRFLSHYIYNKNSDNKRGFLYKEDKAVINPFVNSLEFKLTKGQAEAVNEILGDLKSPYIMNRMLQGDVGSGKTIAAFIAIYYVAKCGGQCAFIAPTEILARQHYLNAIKYFGNSGLGVCFLSGSVSGEERETTLFNIKNNVCKIIVGTHSLIFKDVEFSNLKLVICDEQHRFGVKQRNDLKNKGCETDMLIMSATPLPRTLNLALYGELAVSVISDKPESRITVKTNIVPGDKVSDMYDFIIGLLKEGRQAYIVSKCIDSDETENDSAKKLYAELSKTVFKGFKTGLLHGKMTDSEKEKTMYDFTLNKINVLVSTSVIEVGIDVKNAAVIVIYEAGKFGLSQLHQLRGRVGRGEFLSYCFLLCGNVREEAYERLKILKNNDNGFILAQKDFELRGAGSLLGLNQHGKTGDYIKNLDFDSEVITKALNLFKEAVRDKDYEPKIIGGMQDSMLKDVILN